MKTLFWLALLLPAPCGAVKTIMEGIPATNNAVYISTGGTGINGAQIQLLANATAYNGGISSVGVYIGSNVVVSNTNSTNKCVIYSTGSLTCLSLVGDGSGITGISVLSATQTFSGANTFQSSTTIGGSANSALVVNSSTSFNGMVYGNIFPSSITKFTAAYNTTSTSWVTFAASSLTITTNGGRVEMWLNCNCKGGLDGQSVAFAVLEDSAYFDDQTAAIGLHFNQDLDAGGAIHPCGFFHVTNSTRSSASHTYVLYFKTGSSTLTINSGNNQVCQWGVREYF